MDFATEIRSKQLIKSQDNCSCEMLGQMAGQTAGSILGITFLSWHLWSEAGVVDGLAGLAIFGWAIGVFRWLCRLPGALIGQLGIHWANG